MTDRSTSPSMPIVCDMTGAPDTAEERIAEYERLFAQALIGRQHTDDGIRFRFGADPGVEEWVADLAAREKACCAFFDFAITRHGSEIWWDASVVDNDTARTILEELYQLPDTASEGIAGLHERSMQQGLQVVIEGDGITTPRHKTRS